MTSVKTWWIPLLILLIPFLTRVQDLDFGHSGIDPLQTRQERAGGVLKIGQVWCEGRHHEITWPPMPLQLSPHLPAIFLLSGLKEEGQS
jgi:hypothetical protein